MPTIPKLISVVTPAFHESLNLPVLYERLKAAVENLAEDWEWVIVDDHSTDETFAVASGIARRDPRVRVIRLSRNSGSHHAAHCGLMHAQGQCAVLMASDLQDPPEIIGKLVEEWARGGQLVWGCRKASPGITWFQRLASKGFVWIQRNILGLKNFPPRGADLFLVDRAVIEQLRPMREVNIDLLSILFWMGFAQSFVYYEKDDRLHGRSGWTFRKKVSHVIIAVCSFSGLPLRMISFLGGVVALCGMGYAAVAARSALNGKTPSGWASLMVVTLLLNGTVMIMLGVLGEYVWRCLQQARQRPPYFIEAIAGTFREPLQSPAEQRSLLGHKRPQVA